MGSELFFNFFQFPFNFLMGGDRFPELYKYTYDLPY